MNWWQREHTGKKLNNQNLEINLKITLTWKKTQDHDNCNFKQMSLIVIGFEFWSKLDV